MVVDAALAALDPAHAADDHSARRHGHPPGWEQPDPAGRVDRRQLRRWYWAVREAGRDEPLEVREALVVAVDHHDRAAKQVALVDRLLALLGGGT